MICLIVAQAKNGVIGLKNDLPWQLSADLRRFKELTTGQTVLMGRKTYESITARLGHALPNRRNIVLTRQNIELPDAEVVHSLDEVSRLGDLFIIGGAEVYRATIGMADRLYITEVKANIEGDAYFPAVDTGLWREVSREPRMKDEKNQYDFDFVIYERV